MLVPGRDSTIRVAVEPANKEWIAAAGVVVLAVLSFLPIRFLHPLRVRHWRWLNVALLALWAALALAALVAGLQPGPAVTVPLCIIALYFFAAGLIRRPA